MSERVSGEIEAPEGSPTGLDWSIRLGLFTFSGVLGGYSRMIFGPNREQLVSLAIQMDQGRA